jgi:hypothetical protein
MLYETRVVVRDKVGWLSKEVFIYRLNPDGSAQSYDGKEYETRVEQGGAVTPALILHDDMAQKLLEALLAAGMKALDESYLKGKNEALESHLGDMRALVFKHDAPS